MHKTPLKEIPITPISGLNLRLQHQKEAMQCTVEEHEIERESGVITEHQALRLPRLDVFSWERKTRGRKKEVRLGVGVTTSGSSSTVA
ncbi:hypothetical protein Pyn_06924 [Prunus yedoensis var. nudiflora]|uniref:Uncharacterized protein n=1 Tax=Prunus yedoensis var. nudiflora TaxID=2094558 RepID=A0A314YZ23_PRUYE|nr:hypothetical protein Pyn_06924 [Prunus yedoensis var. nudiflora]